MKIILSLISVILFLPVLAEAQKVELYGYYEPQYLGNAINDGYGQLFSNKLRVDLQTSELENMKFAANFDYISYHGKTEWNILHFIPDTLYSYVPQFLRDSPIFVYDYRDTVFLDNAYIEIAFPRMDLTVGKQQISFGTGYVWNPTDLFNYNSITDPTYEQPGHNAARLDIQLSGRYNMTLLYGPEKDWAISTKLARFKGGLGHFDFSAMYIEKQEESLTLFAPVINSHRRRLLGGDFAGELLGLGVWGEFGYNRIKGLNNYSEIDAGIDYTLDNDTYILAEYYHNEKAKSDYEDFDLYDWIEYFAAYSKTISRDNFYLYSDYPLTDLIHINGSVIGSLNDGSFAIVPGANYNFRQNVELDLFININLGNERKSYSREQGQSGLLRMRVYF